MFDLLFSPEFWTQIATSSVLLAALGALLTPIYKSWIERGIQSKFDKQIEVLRSEVRREEDRLKGEIKAQEDRLAALRSGALSGMVARQGMLDRKRLEALEEVWEYCCEQGPARLLARLTETLNMPYALEGSSAKDPQGESIRTFAAKIMEISGIMKAAPSSIIPEKLRIFVPPLVWALFSTYRGVITLRIAQLAAVQAGAGAKLLQDSASLVDLVRTALPHKSEYLDKYGEEGLVFLVTELEDRVFTEVVRALDDPGSDEKSVALAANIMASVDKVPSGNSALSPPDIPGLRSSINAPTIAEKAR